MCSIHFTCLELNKIDLEQNKPVRYVILFYYTFIHAKKKKYVFSLQNQISNCASTVLYRPFIFLNLSHHVTTKYPSRKRFPNAGDNMAEFTDFNTQCCPKIRLCGWQKASHCTLVILVRVLRKPIRVMLKKKSRNYDLHKS